MEGSIQVAVRARTVLPSDQGSPPELVVDVNEPEGQIYVGLSKSFAFDTCFDGDATQVSIVLSKTNYLLL